MKILLSGEKVVLRDITEADIRKLYYYYHEADDREHLNWNGPYKPLNPVSYEESPQNIWKMSNLQIQMHHAVV